MAARKQSAAEWLQWVRDHERVARKSQRPPTIARLAELAAELEVPVPRDELKRASEMQAFRVTNCVIGSSVTWYDSPACDDEEVRLHALGTFGHPRRADTNEIPLGAREGDWELKADERPLRGIALSLAGELPIPIATPDVSGGWGWLLLSDLGEDEPEGWLLPFGLTCVDATLLHASGLDYAVLQRSERCFESLELDLVRSPRDATKDAFVRFVLARLREAATRWAEHREITVRPKTRGRSLAKGCALVLERIARVEALLDEAAARTTGVARPPAAWPDAEIEDEDELAKTLVEAYSARAWSVAEIRRLLERGGRRKQPAKQRRWPKGIPPMLRMFFSECATRGHGLELARTPLDTSWGPERLDDGGPLFEVFSVGNGDRWVCTPGNASKSMYVDHEARFERRSGVPLGSLLASWLFYDEVMARGLSEQVDIVRHAAKLCSGAKGSVFPEMDV